MGLLDNKSRVIDFVLTERGRRLYSAGKLDFKYFAVFDDEVDYNPYTTGSITDTERELIIENGCVSEAVSIVESDYPFDKLMPRSHVFTAESDFVVIPHVELPSTGSYRLEYAQMKGSGGIVRDASNIIEIPTHVSSDSNIDHDGFEISVYFSGSSGLVELDSRHDLAMRRAFDAFITVSVDDERVELSERAATVSTRIDKR